MKRCMMGIFLGLMLLWMGVAFASAEVLPEFSVSHMAGENGEESPAVQEQRLYLWRTDRGSHTYLFLPSFADAQTLRVHFTTENASIGGVEIGDGEQTGLLRPGETASIRVGKRQHEVEVLQTTGVPTIFIQTENGTLDAIHADKTHQETGTMLLVDAEGTVIYDGALRQFKGRGNSTFRYDKKPYQIKLEDKTDLLGMGKARTWVLLANYNDYSLLRNQVAFDLASAVGLAYSPEARSVDLYIDGEYRGLYTLCEKVQIDTERISITELEAATEKANDEALSGYESFGPNTYREDSQKGLRIPNDPDDITGGYLLEVDYPMRYREGASGFVTRRGQAVVIKEPEYASLAQVEYIRGLVQGVEDALRAEDGVDPETGKHFTQLLDMDSFVRKYLLEEMVKNYDGNKSSQYFYKPSDEQSSLLYAGPVWDYDSALGNYAPEHNPKFSRAENIVVGIDSAKAYYVYPAAYRQQVFYDAVVQTWFETYEPQIDILLGQAEGASETLRSIRQYAEEIEASAAMNFLRWPIVRQNSRHPVDTGSTFMENIEYLETFVRDRAAFLRETWSAGEE